MLTTLFVVIGVGVGVWTTPWVTVAAFVIFSAVVICRGIEPAHILGTVVGVSGAVLLVADVLSVTQPFKAMLASLLPVAVYFACDRDSAAQNPHG
ncbi:hypothetical protein [Conexibacter arvalis]|uniref:Uncharacterized protein n=1 Tax=Conexibacter arvalis TaxID=912552 RepID=A0A840IB98_9ACTN|nr:hypothetical protein [Conexibacter arvalis]MBB4662197.1 hypothetical protein [Conexibacter arvalis]